MADDILKLAALDEDDLAVISAHVQDAVFKVSDVRWEPGGGHFMIPMNRFVWEKVQGKRRATNERRRTVLQFDRVTAVKAHGIARTDDERVLSLLAVMFTPGDAPSGVVNVICSGEAAFRLEVECIETRLTDLGSAWAASARPKHVTGL